MQRDIHYEATKALAVIAGFEPLQARTIAFSNYMTDCTALTQWRPWSFQNPGKYFHFVENKEGVVEANAPRIREYIKQIGIVSNVFERNYPSHLIALGMSLHALQDSFAHQGWTGRWDGGNVVTLKADTPWWRRFLPPYGHTQMMRIPDRVEQLWTDTRTNETCINAMRFDEALRRTYQILCVYRGKAFDPHEIIPVLEILEESEYDQRKIEWRAISGENSHFSDIKRDMYITYKKQFRAAAKAQRSFLRNLQNSS